MPSTHSIIMQEIPRGGSGDRRIGLSTQCTRGEFLSLAKRFGLGLLGVTMGFSGACGLGSFETPKEVGLAEIIANRTSYENALVSVDGYMGETGVGYRVSDSVGVMGAPREFCARPFRVGSDPESPSIPVLLSVTSGRISQCLPLEGKPEKYRVVGRVVKEETIGLGTGPQEPYIIRVESVRKIEK